MDVLNKMKTFFSYDAKTMFLLVEACFYLGWARILIHSPFSKVVSALNMQMQETSDIELLSNRVVLKNVKQAIHIMSNHTFWDSKCLVRAIAGMKMLERREIESTLYLGTAKDEYGKMIAHAWLRSGTFYLTGSEGMEKFTVVGKFSKQIKVDG